jgi:type IV secretory pathway TrbF-like protein
VCVVRKMFDPSWEKVTGRGRKMHNEYPNDLNSSPDITAIMVSRKVRSVVRVSRNGER